MMDESGRHACEKKDGESFPGTLAPGSLSQSFIRSKNQDVITYAFFCALEVNIGFLMDRR